MTIPAILCVDGLLDDLDRFRKRLAEPTGRPAGIGWFLRMDPALRVARRVLRPRGGSRGG